MTKFNNYLQKAHEK